jgi:mono/diheme cytochrome c family protein
MTTAAEPLTPSETARKRTVLRVIGCILFVLFVAGIWLYWRICPEVPERHGAITEHFKYGSIGADNSDRGIPFWLFQVLPEIFPEHLPKGSKQGYETFGFIQEPERDRPIGFSKRRVKGIELVGLNCAVCHTGQYRAAKDSRPTVVLGMPANTVDLQAFFEFLFKVADDPRFQVSTIMERIRARTQLDFYESLAYPIIIPTFKEKVLEQKKLLEYMQKIPKFGPGRVDTFTPYKRLFFTDMKIGDAIGTADFPSLWRQRPRHEQRMDLHWDGNNQSVDERNISAALGAGVRLKPTTLDEPSMQRIKDWIFDLSPPAFPADKLDPFQVRRGADVFRAHCSECHDWKGAKIGKVTKIEEIKTDPNRLESFTAEMATRMNTLGEGYPWHFRHFRKQDGYANQPLDGIWLRGPYLHNGSVPTLHHLLLPAKDRPKTFWRGNDLYDWRNVGFVHDDRAFFEFDTSLRGNGNQGHEYGTTLPEDQRKALLEYLKTL